MKKLDELRQAISEGKFPNQYPEFGGADLIITKNKNRNYHEGDTVVYSDHAAALSWLVIQLKDIYKEELDYINKYEFYPSIGEMIIKNLSTDDILFDVMLHIVNEMEEKWGTK